MIVLCSNEAALGHYAGGMRQRLDAGYGIGFKRNQVGRKAFAVSRVRPRQAAD